MTIKETVIRSSKPLSLTSKIEKDFYPSSLLIVNQVFLKNSGAMLDVCELVNTFLESNGKESTGK